MLEQEALLDKASSGTPAWKVNWAGRYDVGMPEPSIKVIPTEYRDVLDLLHSDCLRQVEQAIASQVGMRIIEDNSPACTNYTQADMSVSGMTAAQFKDLLTTCRDEIIAFWSRVYAR